MGHGLVRRWRVRPASTRRAASTHPRALGRELFERFRAFLDGHPYTRATEHTFAFTGLVACGLCGKAFTAEIKKGVYIYYRCAQNCRRGVKYVPEKKLVQMILAEVANLRMPDDKWRAVITALKDSRRLVEEETKTRLAAATQRIDRLGRLIDKAYEDKLEGRVDEAFFNEKRVEWEEGRIEAAREVERLTRASAASLDAGIRVFELANSAYDPISEREPLEQRDLLKFLFSNFTITEGALSVTWREPFNLLALSPDPENGNGADSDEQNRRRSEWSGWSNDFLTGWPC